MQKHGIKLALLTLVISLFGLAVPASTAAVSAPLSTVAASCSEGAGGLSSAVFTPWYKYLPSNTDDYGRCVPEFPKKNGDETDVQKGIVLVLLAVIEFFTRISALVAVLFVVIGSVQYLTSQGEPQNLANARSTIINALIGFAIVLLATGIVQFLGRTFS